MSLCARCEKALRADEKARLGQVCLSCAWGLALDDEPPSLPGLEILAPLGRGGMGRVYKARQASLGRVVAVKVLSPSLAGAPEFLRRFEREARAIGQLDHPGLVRVHDFVPHPETPYLVLEYVEGESLRKRLNRGPLPPAEAAALAARLCDALEAAHARGVVHRDLKPENVLLTPEGGVKVVDFGLARPADEPRVTLPETRMGTPAYMPPEGAAEAGPRADLFSLGVIFYEMMTGKRPVGTFAPPPRHARLVRRLLDPDPRRRPASAAAVARRLRRLPRVPWAVAAVAIVLLVAVLARPAEIDGPLSDTPAHALYPKVATADGRVFAAWQELDPNGRRIAFRAWNGRRWMSMGGPLSDAPQAGHLSVRVGPDAHPVVSWRELREGENWEVALRRWDGRAWVGLGGSAAPGGLSAGPGNSWNPELALDGQGRPVVAWQEEVRGARTQIYVKRWSGSAWEELAGSASGLGISASESHALLPQVAVDPSGRPVVAWTEETGRGPAYVRLKRWSGIAWEELGDGVSGPCLAGLGLALDADSRPLVAWTVKVGEREDLRLAVWNGRSWADAGSPTAGEPSVLARGPRLLIDPRGGLAVLWHAGPPSAPLHRGRIKRGAEWSDLPAFQPGERYVDGAFDAQGRLHLVWTADEAGRPRVFFRRIALP